jgi:hypothetical protein
VHRKESTAHSGVLEADLEQSNSDIVQTAIVTCNVLAFSTRSLQKSKSRMQQNSLMKDTCGFVIYISSSLDITIDGG